MCHRIRFGLADSNPSEKLKGTVEADETYMGGKARGHGRGYVKNKVPVVSLVERGGRVLSQVTPMVTGNAMGKLLRERVEASAHLNTDESLVYKNVGKDFASHDTVNHGKEEYSRNDKVTGRKATTNTVEGYFGNSKRSIDVTHHNISQKHMNLYFAELDFKYNTRKVSDGERTVKAIRKVKDKRLMLRSPKASVA
jgi:transposase-like protein